MIVMENAETILNRYRSWSGDLEALAAAAADVQAALGISQAGAPKARLIRHYQTMGCIGRPQEREGKRGIFDYRHLLEALSVRVLLADGWTLAHIGELLAEMDDVTVEGLVLNRGQYRPVLSQASGQPVTAVAKSEQPEVAKEKAALSGSDDALALIAGFRTAAGLVPQKMVEATASRPVAVSPAHKSRALAEYVIAPWLRVTVDEHALARAEHGTVIRVLAEADALIKSLKR